MPSPVRIEAGVWDDWRFQSLASDLGVELEAVVGRVAKMWSFATDRGLYAVPEGAVRAHLKHPDAVQAFVAADLGERLEDGTIRLKGSKRFEDLWRKREQGRRAAALGGDARRDAQRGPDGQFATGNTEHQPTGQPESSQGPASNHPITTPSVSGSVSVSSSTPEPPKVPQGGRRVRKSKGIQATDAEIAGVRDVLASLNKYASVDYRATSATHVETIVTAMRRGYTALDLRKVAWFLAVKKNWRNDEKFREHLTPSTLFGRKKLDEYADQARARYRQQFDTDDDTSARGPPPASADEPDDESQRGAA